MKNFIIKVMSYLGNVGVAFIATGIIAVTFKQAPYHESITIAMIGFCVIIIASIVSLNLEGDKDECS